MKKLLIATLLSAFALSAHSQVYVQADLGSSRVALEDEAGGEDVISGTVFTQRLSVGYDFQNNFRVAVDYTNYGTAKEDYTTYTESMKFKSLGVTGFYDFTPINLLTPYLGLRLAYTNADLKYSSRSSYFSYQDSYSDSSLGLGIMAGAQYKLTNNVSLNANLEYNRVASNAFAAGANIGIKYSF